MDYNLSELKKYLPRARLSGDLRDGRRGDCRALYRLWRNQQLYQAQHNRRTEQQRFQIRA